MSEAAGYLLDSHGLLQADDFQPMPIAPAHALRAVVYNQPHRDPFDRMLTADPKFSTFPCITPR